MRGLRQETGFTLIELVLTIIIVTVIFMGVGSIYSTALKNFVAQMRDPSVNATIAFERITRDINIANDVVLGAQPDQISLLVDNQDPATASTADDVWVTYRFLGTSLVTRTSAAQPSSNLTAADPEVVPGLSVSGNFSLLNPSAVGSNIVVNVSLTSGSILFTTHEMVARSK